MIKTPKNLIMKKKKKIFLYKRTLVLRSNFLVRLNERISGMRLSAFVVAPFIIIKNNEVASEKLLRHEAIHVRQTIDLIMAGFICSASWQYFFQREYQIGLALLASMECFPLFYLLIKIFFVFTKYKPNQRYLLNAFEQEAYLNENKDNYLERRIPFAWVKYFFSKNNLMRLEKIAGNKYKKDYS